VSVLFKSALFIAALGHAKKAPQSSERRAYALYYVECVIRDLRKKRHFTLAFAAQDLLSEMRAAPLLHDLKTKYDPNRPTKSNGEKQRAMQSDGAKHTPAGNTGVTPVQMKILEDYI